MTKIQSRPPRARGLKRIACPLLSAADVAPPAGAWIETGTTHNAISSTSRAPRGRVD